MKEDKEKCKKCNISMFCDGENCEETINKLGGAVVLGNFYNESGEKVNGYTSRR